jgi:Prolyl oligopeptidase, N-terminal beta-propeller domain
MFPVLILTLILLTLVSCFAASDVPPYWSTKETPFPSVRRVNKTWSYRCAKANGNVTLLDPYAWLEESIDTPEVQQFIDNELGLTEKYMAKCKNYDAIKQSIRDVYGYDRYGKIFYVPKRNDGAFYFYDLRLANENHKTYYIATPEGFEAAIQTNFAKPPGKKYLSESLLSVNGTATIRYYTFSETGLFIYSVIEADSQVGTWYIRRLHHPLTTETTKTIIPGGEGRMDDVIPSCRSGYAWNNGTIGFFYVQRNDPKTSNTTDVGEIVRFHKIGTSHENDITIVETDTDEGNYWNVDTNGSGKWLVV